jgi:Protein of unknown function (DUF1573)
MNKLIYFLIITVLFPAACHNKPNTYKNDLGIEPRVIAQIDTANYTAIEWKDTVKNFGVVKEGDSVFIKFRFKNTGDKVLFVTEVLPSCGCIIADYSKEPVLPGNEGAVTATFNSRNYNGQVHKTIIVITNTSNKYRQLLSFNGEVKDSLPAAQ